VLAYALHIGAGSIGLASGLVAACAPKGGDVHRKAGTVFVVSMLVMATFACVLAVAIPGQIVNLFIGTFVFYLVTTGWMTVHREEGRIGNSEKIALFVSVCLCAPFAILAFQLATGMAPLFETAVPFQGPVLIAIYSFTGVLAIAAIGDARLLIADGIRGPRRIARHLWRMCLGLTLATGSAFTNGFARLLPGAYHVPPVFFFPQFLPLGLLIYWTIRLRFTGWHAPQSYSRRESRLRGHLAGDR
jgi:hypothetical protein